MEIWDAQLFTGKEGHKAVRASVFIDHIHSEENGERVTADMLDKWLAGKACKRGNKKQKNREQSILAKMRQGQ